jgi:hypothetical protein
MLDIDEANLSPVLWPSFSGTGRVLKSSCIIIKPVSTDRSQLMAKKNICFIQQFALLLVGLFCQPHAT